MSYSSQVMQAQASGVEVFGRDLQLKKFALGANNNAPKSEISSGSSGKFANSSFISADSALEITCFS